MKKFIIALLLSISTFACATETLSVTNAGSYLVKLSNGTVVTAPGFVGTIQYFTDYSIAVSLAATTARKCNCVVWVTQPSLKVTMISDAPVATTLKGSLTPGQATFTWNMPTIRQNGVALTPTEISKYVITITVGTTVKTVEVMSPNLTVNVPLTSGLYTATIACVDISGLTSVASNSVSFQL
jgi:hypothetical protein